MEKTVWQEWFIKREGEIKKDLFALLAFPSISTDPKYKDQTRSCAKWLVDYVGKIGFKTSLLETPIHPIVYGENLEAGPKAPTLLIYGHYDVQPVDPLQEWKSDPFTPEMRDGKIFARGALDNKGQLMYTLAALKAFIDLHKRFPLNIKLCIEGEEEAASIGLTKTLPELKERLKADYLLVPDFDLPEENTPAITLGVRGILACEFTLTGSSIDLHSGQHGGLAYNPNRAIAEILADLWDQEGRVQIPGFYDDVQELDLNEKREISFAFDTHRYSKEFGIQAFGGEKEYEPLERNWIRPTVEINGMAGGYIQEGFKTVIPAKAFAKLSCRLVANQDPHKIMKGIEAFLQARVPKGMTLSLHFKEGAPALRGAPSSPLVKACSQAYEEVFHKKTEKILSGGSVPIMSKLVAATGADILFMGMGLGTDNIHAPNEHFSWDRFQKGFLVIAKTISHLGSQTS